MNALPQITQRRIRKLPQVHSVWEGDRRDLSGIGLEKQGSQKGECINWVDRSERYVRAMDVVSSDMGPEAVVRTLLRAIETPDRPAQPARPQKIVVCDREIQFFLRGALQSLGIDIDYVRQLPRIDELFHRFEEVFNSAPLALSPQYERLLEQVSQEIWREAPWEVMADRDIIAIELNQWEVNTVYACVMGMLGREYGIVLYRSLESLKQFRGALAAEDSIQGLEQAFLAQDCWFLNFELEDEEEGNFIAPWHSERSPQTRCQIRTPALQSPMRPLLGSIHPYEGMRSLRDEEEASVVYAALKALARFFESSQPDLALETINALSKRYCISVAPERGLARTVSVRVSTMPELTRELLEIELTDLEDDEVEEISPPIREDLVPQDAFVSIGVMPWELVIKLRDRPKVYYQSQAEAIGGEGLPVILIQTSRPKAKKLIEKLSLAGGLTGICFNPGEDSLSEIAYDLGIFLTGNGELSLFGEFANNDPQHIQARQKWVQRCRQTNSCCGLILAMGITGLSRGNPRLQDMLALFETNAIDAEELGLGVLELNLI